MIVWLQVVNELWASNVRAEHSYKRNPKMLSQLQYCEDQGIPLAVVLGESELAAGLVKLRDVASRAEQEVSRVEMVQKIQARLQPRLAATGPATGIAAVLGEREIAGGVVKLKDVATVEEIEEMVKTIQRRS